MQSTNDHELLTRVTDAVTEAGKRLADRFSLIPDLRDRDTIWAALRANDAVSEKVLRPALAAALPGAGWVEDEGGEGALPPGEWWVTDPVEGNINHAHGNADWCVSATLIRDNVPVLTAVHLPLAHETYTAVRGSSAYLNGVPLRPSSKRDLGAALVATCQAVPGEDTETLRRIEQSVGVMLDQALLVRVLVPATLQLVQLAAGRVDLFWQHSRVRSGLVAGALLVEEAGGVVTDLKGKPWTVESRDFLASAPNLHAPAIAALSTIS